MSTHTLTYPKISHAHNNPISVFITSLLSLVLMIDVILVIVLLANPVRPPVDGIPITQYSISPIPVPTPSPAKPADTQSASSETPESPATASAPSIVPVPVPTPPSP